jgi:hypothetical protein
MKTLFFITGRSGDLAEHITERDIQIYAKAMQEDSVDDLPRWLQLAVNNNPEYRSLVIDYYLWLEYPDEYSKPILETPPKNKGKIQTGPIVYWGAAACIAALLALYPLGAKYYLQWQQEKIYAANFRENPTRDAVFLGVRMNVKTNPAQTRYTLKNTLSKEGKIPTLTGVDFFRLEWELRPDANHKFETQEVTLQIWNTSQPTPVFKQTFEQKTIAWEAEFSPNIEPGIYYLRLQFDNQVETLAKLKFYRSNL